jgi:hypothetical protein
MTRTSMRACWLALFFAGAGCDPGGGGTSLPPTGSTCTPPATIPGSTPVTWSATGTAATPAYGKACRLVTDQVYSDPTNCAEDDTLVLTTSRDFATATVEVKDEEGVSFSASLTLERALDAKSYRAATGSATFGRDPALTGTVIDGTLCFNAKLSAGTDLLAEFSVVVEQGGVTHAVGGHFAVAAALVDAQAIAVNATGALDVDLR